MIACYYRHENAVVKPQFALSHALLLPSRVSVFARLSDVSQDDTITRVVVAVTHWIKGYCVLHAMFSIAAIIGVCLEPRSVREWRPALDSVAE